MTLKKAVVKYRERSTNCYEVEAIDVFVALYGMLGEDELYDGIATTMQDHGYEETYEEIMYFKDEHDEIDDIITESGE